MNVLLVLIPLSILLALGAGIAFFWAVDHDQFDDLDTPKLLPLLDDPHAAGEAPADHLRRPGEHRAPAPSSAAAPAPAARPRDSEREASPSPRPSAPSPRQAAR